MRRTDDRSHGSDHGPDDERLDDGRLEAERGGATVLLLAIGLVFVLFGTFGAAIAAAGMARQRAAVAADLGALAGAARALDGDAKACASAGDIAGRNGGRLAGCRLDGLDVLVTVEVAFTPLPGMSRVAASTARAGPLRG
ncbi:Rv3654c family TadE-like protein [Micromonospora orduensis]|uniref:Rv3654c family TadE-like protein n=1 Tax=Micromonospora orduensis TaxID=1420891 RepID=UPI00382F9C09